jgi:hypothetical protein
MPSLESEIQRECTQKDNLPESPSVKISVQLYAFLVPALPASTSEKKKRILNQWESIKHTHEFIIASQSFRFHSFELICNLLVSFEHSVLQDLINNTNLLGLN